jgi:DNA-binding NarL/FixJ family response regulator
MIILASDNIDILSAWGDALRGSQPISVAASVEDVLSKLPASTSVCVVFDRELAQNELIQTMHQIRKVNMQTQIVLLTGPEYLPSDEEDLALLRIGIRGFCCTDMDSEMIRKVLNAVSQGQIWVRRSLIPALIEEFSKQAKGAIEVSPMALAGKDREALPTSQPLDQFAALTPREREIAVMIGNGECNKHIARQLQITERTVKAHLTVIFRKLHLSDRVHLALLVSQQIVP